MDPEAWKIIDGKLYLNWSKKTTRKFFGENASANIKKADDKWAEMTKAD